MCARFFLRAITLNIPLPGLSFGHLRNPSINTHPANSALATTALRVFFGVITLEFAGLCIGHAHLRNVSIDADPAKR
jgi:hypothetical protein